MRQFARQHDTLPHIPSKSESQSDKLLALPSPTEVKHQATDSGILHCDESGQKSSDLKGWEETGACLAAADGSARAAALKQFLGQRQSIYFLEAHLYLQRAIPTQVGRHRPQQCLGRGCFDLKCIEFTPP